MEERTLPERRTVAAEPEPLSPPQGGDRSLGILVRRLADDGRLLVQQEIALAKVEIQSNATTFAKRSALIALGIAVLLVGLLVLLAFLILALGVLLGERYWLSSLIIGAALAAVGLTAVLVGRSGLARQKVKPQQTVETLRENADWARAEAHQLKSELTRSDRST